MTPANLTTDDFLFGAPSEAPGIRIEHDPNETTDAVLVGAAGADTLSGSGGNNRFYSYEGDDVLVGGAGHDALYAGDGADTVDGGAGHDRFFDADGMSGDVYIGGDDIDVVNYTTGTIFDFSAAGADRLDASVEWARFKTPSAVTVTGTTAGEGFTGSLFNDTISAGAGDDRLQGRAGDDILNGDAGNDRLDGGSGADTLHGGAGADRLDGGGADGAIDTFVFEDGWGHDLIWDFEDNIDVIDMTGVSGLTDLSQLTFRETGTGTMIEYGDDQIFVRDATEAMIQDDLIF